MSKSHPDTLLKKNPEKMGGEKEEFSGVLVTGAVFSYGVSGVLIGFIIVAAVLKILTTELIFNHASFYKENNGWAVHHHSNKFLFADLYGTSLMYYYPGDDELWGGYKRTYCIGLNALYFLTGEILEKKTRNIVNAIWSNSTWFEGYSSETLDDVILSDGTQGLAPVVLKIFFFIRFITPFVPSSLIFWNKTTRGKVFFFIMFSVVHTIFTSSTFLGTIDVRLWGDVYRIGFFAQFFLRLGILFTYCYLDFQTLSEIKEEEDIEIKKSSIRWSWAINFTYFVGVYVPTMANMKLWGLVYSNAYTLVLFFVFWGLKTVTSFSFGVKKRTKVE
jgi:hypothetical protein